jgi:hypothetical protein
LLIPHTETYIDGIWYPSVTTVMGAEPKPWLDAWRAKWGALAERKTMLAGIVGDEFHRCVEQYLDTGSYTVGTGCAAEFPPSCIRRVEGMMKSFVTWALGITGVIDATELRVVSWKHHYSGTFDAVGTFNGKPMLYDWKTSARIYPEYEMQLAAYAQAYEEQTGIKVKEGMIVHVSKDKPRFRMTTKTFKLGKRVLKKFLKLRDMFDDVQVEVA